MIIKNQDELNNFCRDLAAHDFITIDTEFLREKTYYPKLCLVQLSGPDKNAKAIDPLVGDLDLTPLFDLLADESVLKIFHAARQDLEIFYNLTGKVVTPFFDTQIAAMVCGFGDSVGYENLVKNICNKQLDKSSQFTDWSNRPLSEKQLNYALGDVTHLVDIYKHLSQKLEERGRTSWVFQEEGVLNDPATYANDPQESYKRIKIRSPRPKTLAILRELAAWREKRAQDKDIPRPWVMRDDTLADMAGQAPKDAKHLAKIRNFSKDLARGSVGETLLEIIKKAGESDKSTWPKVVKRRPPPPHISSTIDILKLLLKVQCAENDVATKLVASKEDIEALATGNHSDVPAMQGWRYEVFGQHIEALKKGELAIGLKDDNIKLFKTNS